MKLKKRILLVGIDSKYPNLALEKIKTHYARKGYEIVENYKKLTQKVERIYVSCLFTWNLGKALRWLRSKAPVILGGSGVNIYSHLPPEIENEKPRINWGYTSRGCVRRCPWCLVWKKEGYFRVVGDLLDLWDGRSRDITLLDNNILADREHFQKVCWQAVKYNIRLNFFQGLDYRFLDEQNCLTLANTRHKRLRLSFDEPKNWSGVDRAIINLERVGIFYNTWFVLVGYNTTLLEDLQRIYFLRRRGQKVYLARYNFNPVPRNIPLARWTQSFKYFAKMDFWQFLNLPENKKWFKLPVFRNKKLLEGSDL